jgi:DNA polymerase IV (DinB-like DNA polymerase)
VSIDEAYLDLSLKTSNYREAKSLALRIKREIKDREKLTCSVGIGPNKLVAKIASDMKKPDALTVVNPRNVMGFLKPLPARKIPGVGPKSEAALKKLGVETIGDLSKLDVQRLRAAFGKCGGELNRLSRGVDERQVRERKGVKSMGREITFEEDTNSVEDLNQMIEQLAGDVHDDLVRRGYRFKTISLKIRLEDFSTYTRSSTLEHYTSNLKVIGFTVKKQIEEFLRKGKKIRLIGIRLSGLKKTGKRQKSLIEYKGD